MAELKTKPNDGDVEAFLNAVEGDQKRTDSFGLLDMMKRVTGLQPKMWGSSIVGFGSYHYKYDSGREGDWFVTGFSPRKQNLSIYVMRGFGAYEELLAELGKHKTGVSCLYIKRLSDVNVKVLENLVSSSVNYMNEKYNQK